METVEAIHTRRSIRSYEPRAVARELVEAVIWDAAQSPPPFSGQVPWVFNVFEGVERVAAWGERAKAFARLNRPAGPGWEWTDRTDFQVFWGAPVLVVISGRPEDCCRAGQTLMLSAHDRGLGTCWVGSPMLWLRDPAVRSELGLDEVEPVSAICLGYPNERPAAVARGRPVVIWNADS